MNISVISLLGSIDRRAQASWQLDATGLQWKFLDAVNGTQLSTFPKEYNSKKRLRYFGFHLNPGQIGCFLSHRKAWNECVQSNRISLVLEDDFQLRQTLADVLPIAFGRLTQFDILRLHGVNQSKFKILEDFGSHQMVKHYRDTMGTTAYFLKPQAAARLLEKSRQFDAPVDDFFSHDWIHQLQILSLLPYPIATNGLPSTIAENQSAKKRSIWIKMIRLPRSINKSIYHLKTDLALHFARNKRQTRKFTPVNQSAGNVSG